MNVHQLRRWSDRVVDNGLRNTGEVARNSWNSVYNRAMNSPKTAAAVVLGTSVAAAMLWLANRNGSGKRKQMQARVRKVATRVRRSRAAS